MSPDGRGPPAPRCRRSAPASRLRARARASATLTAVLLLPPPPPVHPPVAGSSWACRWVLGWRLGAGHGSLGDRCASPDGGMGGQGWVQSALPRPSPHAQTDQPLKRAIKPLGGVGIVKNALQGGWLLAGGCGLAAGAGAGTGALGAGASGCWRQPSAAPLCILHPCLTPSLAPRLCLPCASLRLRAGSRGGANLHHHPQDAQPGCAPRWLARCGCWEASSFTARHAQHPPPASRSSCQRCHPALQACLTPTRRRCAWRGPTTSSPACPTATGAAA